MADEHFDQSNIRYSKVWEDCRMVASGLCVNPHDVILSITSAGDNVLNLLLEEPKLIYAVDYNISQSAILELKIACIKCLTHVEFLELLGEVPSTKRVGIFEKVKGLLPDYAKKFWSDNLVVLEHGITWSGRFERHYISVYRDSHLPISDEEIDKFFSAKTIDEQRRYFDNLPLKEMERQFKEHHQMSQVVKSRSKEQVRHVTLTSEEIGEVVWQRMVHTCRNVPVGDNYYLSWFLRGTRGFDIIGNPSFAPPYLTRAGFDKLKGLVDRVTIHTESIEDFLHRIKTPTITKALLSDLFEYLSEEETEAHFKSLAQAMPPGGRVAYWELLNPRKPPPTHYNDLSGDVTWRDRFFPYKCFNVFEVK